MGGVPRRRWVAKASVVSFSMAVLLNLACSRHPKATEAAFSAEAGPAAACADDTEAEQERVVDAVVAAMGITCTNWAGIDQGMQQVIELGDKAVPYLDAILRVQEEGRPFTSVSGEREHYSAYRARYLLAKIGTPRAERCLVRLLGSREYPDEQVVLALAILNKQDVIHCLIDRAYADCKSEGGTPSYLIWWGREGIVKYGHVELEDDGEP